nr:hypothetical protein [Tanacetum cinerariifolium]
MDHALKVLSMKEDKPTKVQEVVDVFTTAKLITEVVTAASTIISAAEPQVPTATITAALVRVIAASTRRRKKVVIRDPKEESIPSSIIHADIKSKDKGKGIMQKAKEDPAVQRYQVKKRNPQTKAQARKNMIMYLKNVVGFRLDYFKRMSYDDIQSQAEIYKVDMDHTLKVLSMKEDKPTEVQDVVDVFTTAKLITEVVTAASTIISAAEPQVPTAKITAALVRVIAASTRRRKKVVIRDPEEESIPSSIIHADIKSKDKGKGIMVE